MDLTEVKGYDLLVKAILSVKTEAECTAAMVEGQIDNMINDMAQRMLVAKLLSEQTVYNKIVEGTGASTTTISRVNRAYTYGSGGYKRALSEILEEKK